MPRSTSTWDVSDVPTTLARNFRAASPFGTIRISGRNRTGNARAFKKMWPVASRPGRAKSDVADPILGRWITVEQAD